MKINWFALALLLSSATQVCAMDMKLGSPSPEIEVRLMDTGDTVQTKQLRGKVVIVNFWATWCAPCRAEMPALQAYLEKHSDEGLEVIAISMDDARDLSAVKKIAQQYSFKVALKADSHISGFGRIWRMPTTFVIDRDGILRKNGQVGDAEIAATELESLVTPLLGR